MHRREYREYSSVSDDALAAMIAHDIASKPNEFEAKYTSSCVTDTKQFLHNTSARGIDPLKKWL